MLDQVPARFRRRLEAGLAPIEVVGVEFGVCPSGVPVSQSH
jgi:hypothetical protein